MGTWLLWLFCLTAARHVWTSGHPVLAVLLAVGSFLVILGWKGRQAPEPSPATSTAVPSQPTSPATAALPFPQLPRATGAHTDVRERHHAMPREGESQGEAFERQRAEHRARREHGDQA